MEYKFEVKQFESGQRRKYGDSYYTYEVTSDRPEYEVKKFCMCVLKQSYLKGDMVDPFCGELLEFTNITNNNEGKSILNNRVEDTYSYKVRYLSTH